MKLLALNQESKSYNQKKKIVATVESVLGVRVSKLGKVRLYSRTQIIQNSNIRITNYPDRFKPDTLHDTGPIPTRLLTEP